MLAYIRSVTNRDGFTMPVVLFGLVIMSTMAVAGLSLSLDDKRSSEGMRQSQEAFYTAESGMQEVWGSWNDTTLTLDSLAKDLTWGATLDLGWDTLDGGGVYHALVTKLDSANNLYLLTMEGRDQTNRSTRALHTVFVGNTAFYTLGGCCEAAAYVRGGVDVNSRTAIDGTDTDPPVWPASACSGYEENTQPGLVMDDILGPDSLEISSSGYIASGDSSTNNASYYATPAIEVEPMTDASFDIYGSKSLDDLKAAATITLGDGTPNNLRYFYGGNPVSDADYDDPDIFGPRVHSLGDGHGHTTGDAILGTCDYDHAMNLGAPTGPCADHFPIVWLNGQIELVTPEYFACDDISDSGDRRDCEEAAAGANAIYAQGLFVMDTLTNGYGSEFELESNGILAGIVVGKGCVELQDGSQTHGAIYLDGSYYDQDLCDGSLPMALRNGGNTLSSNLYYSQCAVQKVLEATGIGELAAGTGAGVLKLTSRYFVEVLR